MSLSTLTAADLAGLGAASASQPHPVLLSPALHTPATSASLSAASRAPVPALQDEAELQMLQQWLASVGPTLATPDAARGGIANSLAGSANSSSASPSAFALSINDYLASGALDMDAAGMLLLDAPGGAAAAMSDDDDSASSVSHSSARSGSGLASSVAAAAGGQHHLAGMGSLGMHDMLGDADSLDWPQLPLANEPASAADTFAAAAAAASSSASFDAYDEHQQHQQHQQLLLAARASAPSPGSDLSSEPAGPRRHGKPSPKLQPTNFVEELTEQEKKLLAKEGITIPVGVPLTKMEERNLKRIRRKIRNKASAMESRRKKKDYTENLEKRVESCTVINIGLTRRVADLEAENKSLLQQLRELQTQLMRSASAGKAKGTCLMIVVLCFAMFLNPAAQAPAAAAPGAPPPVDAFRSRTLKGHLDEAGGPGPALDPGLFPPHMASLIDQLRQRLGLDASDDTASSGGNRDAFLDSMLGEPSAAFTSFADSGSGGADPRDDLNASYASPPLWAPSTDSTAPVPRTKHQRRGRDEDESTEDDAAQLHVPGCQSA